LHQQIKLGIFFSAVRLDALHNLKAFDNSPNGCGVWMHPRPYLNLSGLKARISEVVEEFPVNETIASANPLEQSAFGAVVEELRQVPGGNAALPEDETEGKMLNTSNATASDNA